LSLPDLAHAILRTIDNHAPFIDLAQPHTVNDASFKQDTVHHYSGDVPKFAFRWLGIYWAQAYPHVHVMGLY